MSNSRPLVCSVCFLALVLAAGQTSPTPPPRRVDLSIFGYAGLLQSQRFTTNRFSISLNFIDSDHLLFTFPGRKLLVRHPECPSTHSDHMIHAVVIDLRNSRTVAEADWYMHDFRRYLWALGGGRFLVRRLNSIFEVGPDLKDRLLFTWPSEVLSSGVTADRKQLVVVEAESQQKPQRASAGHSPNPARVRCEFRDVNSLAVKNSVSLSAVPETEPLSSGYADSVQDLSHKVWLIRFGASTAQRRSVARVRSACKPDLLFPTEETLFIGRCSADSPDYSVSVFALTGHPLWRQRWTQRHYYPAIVSSEDGSRIAVSTVTASRDENPSGSGDNEEGWPDVEQDIRVLETATGDEVLTAHAKTVVLRNANYSLSPDGRRLAVIDGTDLSLYDLPAPGAEERAKYLAMKAGAPNLVAPSASPADDMAQDSPGEALGTESPRSSGAGTTPQEPVLAKVDVRNAPTQELPTFKARAEEVVVDVVVTDSKGRTVKGLSKEDFQVEENGKPKSLRSVREYGNGPAGTPKPAATAPPPPNVFSNNNDVAADQPVGIILLDLLNTVIADQEAARQQLIKFLRRKPEGMKFAICTLTDRVQLLQGFTADENLLLANLKSKRARGRFSSELQRSDLGGVIQTLKQEAQFDGKAWLQGSVQNLARQQALLDAAQLDRRAGITADAFAQLARYVSPIPGRKSLVWLSGSFPLAFLGNTSLNADTPNQSNIERTYSDRLRTAANLMAAAHIAVYAVNVHGLTTNALPGADDNSHLEQTGAPGSLGLPSAPGGRSREDTSTNRVGTIAAASPLQQQVQRNTEDRMASEQAMDQVASDTGGKAFQNTNGLMEAIQTAAELGSHYYMLSYSPEKQAHDGSFRKIKVSLLKRGYHVAHRRGYYATDDGTADAGKADVANAVDSAAMQRGSPQARQLVFAARVIPVGKPTISKAKKGPGASQRYSIDYAIAASEVRFGTKGDAHITDLVFLAIAFDDKGTPLNRSAVENTTTLNLKAYQDAWIGGVHAHQDFEAPQAATSLRLGIFDVLSRHVGALELPLPLAVPAEDARITQGKLPPVEPK